MEMVLNNGFCEMTQDDMEMVDGGDVNKTSDVVVGGLEVIGGIGMLFIPGFRGKGVGSIFGGIVTIFS